ncbi:MAG TPA: SRPBCC family protein [Solirubrobacteraceae bacterium]|nr:SRPBCC family protein [Solirubrobacteraceae bacterium]
MTGPELVNAHEPLDLAPFGIRVEFLRTGEDTAGELLEMEVSGRPRGFFSQRHVHPSQVERLEVVSGQLKVTMNGRETTLHPGDVIEVPAGTPHTQVPVGEGDGRVRIQVRPASRTQQFLEQLAKLCREGAVTRSGFPRPTAAAELILEFSETGHASIPSLRVQRTLARLVLAAANASRPYLFVDEWDVAAPPEAVFDALADARTYPVWWQPVYLEVAADGPAQLGSESHQHFKGRLPYHLHTTSVVTELDPPRRVAAEVTGDLRGRGVWTLTPSGAGTHVRFDWQVHADRRLLRILTPLLRPVFRWNHSWAIKAAMRGLEPYARERALNRPEEPAVQS